MRSGHASRALNSLPALWALLQEGFGFLASHFVSTPVRTGEHWLCDTSRVGSGPSLPSCKHASAVAGARIPLAPSEEMTTHGSAQNVPKCRAWAGFGLQHSAEPQNFNTTKAALGRIPLVSQGCFESRASREEPGWLLEAISRGPGSLQALPTSNSLTQCTQSTECFCSLAQKTGPPLSPTSLAGLHHTYSFLMCPPSFP